MRNVQKFGVLSLAIVIFLGVSGCMSNSKNINDVAIEYMEQKYGQTFEYSAPFGNSMSGTHQLLVKCAGFPDHNILVSIENYRKENKTFSDNYIAVKYRNDTIAFFQSAVEQIYGEAKIFYNVAHQSLSPELPVDATFEEFLADTQVPLYVMIEVKASSFSSKDQALQLAEFVTANGSRYSLTIVFVNNDEYGLNDRETHRIRVSRGDFAYCVIIDRLSDETQTRWLEKGKGVAYG